jgi:hypothetical protein
MQPMLYQSKYLSLAEEYYKKSTHAGWDGNKAQANKFGRLCADNYLNALRSEDFENEFKISLYWRAIMQHQEIRRLKTAIDLAQEAIALIDQNENLERHRVLFANFLAQQ